MGLSVQKKMYKLCHNAEDHNRNCNGCDTVDCLSAHLLKLPANSLTTLSLPQIAPS